MELVEKRLNEKGEEVGWTLTLKKLVQTGTHSVTSIWTKEVCNVLLMSLYMNLLKTFQDFDAVVVATGRYNAPNIPDIPGLAAWAERFPDQILHSRQYRHPKPFENKTVMIVGAGASGVEIARDLDTHVKKLLQSVRVS